MANVTCANVMLMYVVEVELQCKLESARTEVAIATNEVKIFSQKAKNFNTTRYALPTPS